MLSQLTVFKDIIPGYRIRGLTDKEKAEKVSQMVTRTRDWEQGLVSAYQNYLEFLDSELKGRRSISYALPESRSCPTFCSKIWLGRRSPTMFMYPSRRGHSLQFPRQYYECHRSSAKQEIVGRGAVILLVVHAADVVRTPVTQASNLCLDSVITVFRADETGVPSLEVVRLLNRMIKERRFNVHSNVLTCLLHLRLKTELGVRASEAKVERETKPEKVKRGKKLKGQGAAASSHLSKTARKALKERKEIEKEMKEAEASVDREERASNVSWSVV